VAGSRGVLTVAVLGPFTVAVDDRPVDLPAGRLRSLLAVLAMSAGQVVSVDRITAALWDSEQPDVARRAVQTYTSRLRTALGTVPISVEPAGYVLDAEPDQVDALRFVRLLDAAASSTDPEAERALLDDALLLWRGTPFGGVPSDWLAQTETPRLVERRLAAVERYVDLWLADEARWDSGTDGTQGRSVELVALLRELVEREPLRETLWVRLLVLLQQMGRPAEALNQYALVRARLADELGTDPGPELQRVYADLLAGPAPKPATAEPATAPPQPSVQATPRQLPASPQFFTGRLRELVAVEEIQDTSTVVISAIDGMAGIGKTALAVHAAHRLADRYPDGQLFIDLHGHTEGMEPVEPVHALDYLLRSLGVPGTQIPADPAERSALYRTRLADRRTLIVLDNAASEAQVQPLLPGTAGCLVLVTSRHRLAGLDRTSTLALDTLPIDDAVRLFIRTVGDDGLADQPPDLVAEVVELCDRLPLAIRIAAARLRSHSAWSLLDLVRRLRDQQHLLAELSAGHRSVAAALDLSYRHLGPDHRRAYRLLGLHPGPDVDLNATAALLGRSRIDAGRTVDQLLEAHLLHEPAAGRYRFHDLVRAHAAQVARDESRPAIDAAVTRLLDYYRCTAARAMDAAYPFEIERRPTVPTAGTAEPDVSDPARALDWLDTELHNVRACADHAAEHGRPEHVVHLSAILDRHLYTRGRYPEAETLHRQAAVAARTTGDRAAEADALTGLGGIHWVQGRYVEAAELFEKALRVARTAGHRAGEMAALTFLGRIHWAQGRPAASADLFSEALRIARATGRRAGELDALTGLGRVLVMQGRYNEAIGYYRDVLPTARVIGHRAAELYALTGLATIHLQHERYAEASEQFHEALMIARASGHQSGELSALTCLGHICRKQGMHAQATDRYQQLLDLAQRNGDRNYEFEARQGLGRLRHITGDPDAAIAHHDEALALAADLGQPLDQARAHDGLAYANQALGRNSEAREHWRQALTILTDIGIEHTDEEETTVAAIRANLAGLGPA
jgi:DNA-binding SARP family transcriptional activator/tetratricopeptide (TPR) repeat protein